MMNKNKIRSFLAPILLALAGCVGPISMEQSPSATTNPATMNLSNINYFTNTYVRTPIRSNVEVARDFIDLSFFFENGRNIVWLSRYEGPITLRVTGAISSVSNADLNELLGRLQREANINITRTTEGEADITVVMVPRAQLARVSPSTACMVIPGVSSLDELRRSGRLSGSLWGDTAERNRTSVFVPSDAPPQQIRDCFHEEIAQALGPMNDLYRLPDSVFNDDNVHGVLTSFDMLILRTYYHRSLRSGMTRTQVEARLPSILAALNPSGQRQAVQMARTTSRDWIRNIVVAQTNSSSAASRLQAARQSVDISEALRLGGARIGFSYYALGRLSIDRDPQLAASALHHAYEIFQSNPQTQLHGARTVLQLAAFYLAAGDADMVLDMVNPSIQVAQNYADAALMATLMLMKAEALDIQGKQSQANSVRMDSIGWARYGFGSEQNVRAKMNEIAALTPGRR